MILKNLMEDKQLDFNRPFRSVRRTRRLPIAAASSESEDKRKTDDSLPKIPPLPAYKSELKSGPIRSPGTVPFQWEKSPGRPKDDSKSQTRYVQRPPITPKLPPGRIVNAKQQSSDKDSDRTTISRSPREDALSISQNALYFNENVKKHESSKQESEDKGSSDSEDDSEAYVDARDTLSRTESSSFNYSVSGLSGLDGPYVKPFGTFSDPQTRDFMMGRFLPAAKAMVSESPHYDTWKQPVARVQPRQVNMVASVDKRQTLYQHRQTNVHHYVQGTEVEESEDSSDDEPEYSSPKVCGLFPQFCLMSPVPGLRMQGSRVPIPSVPRAQAKSSYADHRRKNENKHSRDAMHEQQSIGEQKTKPKSESKQDGSPLYRRSLGNNISPDQNEVSVSQSPLHEANGHIGIPGKGRKNLREMLACKSTEWELESASPVVEKTLYIDSVHVVKSHDSNSSCSDAKGITRHIENGFEILEKEEKREDTHSVDSSLRDIKHKHLDVADEKEISKPKNLESVDSCLLSSSGRSSHDMKMDNTDDLIRDQNLVQDSMTLTSSKIAEDVRTDLENFDFSRGSSYRPLPPPLPKSPSESWLSRTLTAASSRNKFSLSMHNYNKAQDFKTPSFDPKWETIVKTSNTQPGHLRFSEELTPIPEG